MISLRQIRKTYHRDENSEEVLKGIDLDIEKGEFVALVGPSGSGKSTLLHLIGCMDRPTAGTIHFDGRDLGGAPEAEVDAFRRQHLGFIFQTFNLMSLLNAVENVSLSLLGLVESPKERQARAMRVLESVGMADHALKLPRQLSGGQRQRVAIARAFVHKPDLILADEPTANLDRSYVSQVMELLESMRAEFKTTIVLATHDEEVYRRAQRVLRLQGGRFQ